MTHHIEGRCSRCSLSCRGMGVGAVILGIGTIMYWGSAPPHAAALWVDSIGIAVWLASLIVGLTCPRVIVCP